MNPDYSAKSSEMRPAQAPAGRKPGELEAGSLVDQYRIAREIGRGGMGVVYLAHDTILDREVALKVAWPGQTDPAGLNRVLGEARSAARLDHPSIVRIHSAGEHKGRPYVAMEFVPGMSLSRLLALRGTIPESQAIEIARQAAGALASAHGAGLVHRDVKPANIQLTPSGQVKVMDFGIAGPIGTDPEGKERDCFVGTPEYASPEQAGLQSLDGRSDIYSLGVVLFEMLTGRLPFEEDSHGASLRARREREAPRASDFAPAVSKPATALLAKMLARDPRRRYRTALQAAADMEKILGPERPLTEIPDHASAGGVDAPDTTTAIALVEPRQHARRTGSSFLKAVVCGMIAGIAVGALAGHTILSKAAAGFSGHGDQRNLEPLAASVPAGIEIALSVEAPQGDLKLVEACAAIAGMVSRGLATAPVPMRISARPSGPSPELKCRLVSRGGRIWAAAVLTGRLGSTLHSALVAVPASNPESLCSEVSALLLKALVDNAGAILAEGAGEGSASL